MCLYVLRKSRRVACMLISFNTRVVCTLLLFPYVLTLIVRLYFVGKIPHVTFIFKRFIRPKTPEKDQLIPTGASLRSGAHAVAVPRPSELRRNLSKKLYTTFYTRLRRGRCSVVRKTGVQQFVVRNHVLATWRAALTAGTFRRTYYNRRPMAAVLHTTLRSELITPHRPERNPASQPTLCSMVRYFVHGTPRQMRKNLIEWTYH